MAEPIRAIRVNHVNAVVEDHDATIEHFDRVYEGRVVMDLPQATWHACIMDVGRVLFELFAPDEFFLFTRYGPHFLGVELQIEDLPAARELLSARGIRVARELDVAVHTHPADCHGVSLELYEGFFHDNDAMLQAPMQPASYWRDEHPLGITGLVGLTVAVTDLDAGHADFAALFAHDVVDEGSRPAIAATGVSLQVGDAVLDVLAPDGDGPLRDHLLRHGEGIRSTVFGVRDLDQAVRYFAARGFELVPGAAPDALAIPPEQNLGVLFEFVPTG
jgi:hypothetical protein